MATLRAVVMLALLVLVSLVLMPVQIVANRFGWGLNRWLPVVWHRLAVRVLGLRIRVIGAPSPDRPLLMTANHVSWIDIIALSSLAPVSFIAKSEVATWPIFGTLARLQRTVFVDRARRSDTGRVAGEIAARMSAGDAMILFAEGTSSNGNQVLPFRSALVGAAARVAGGDQGGAPVFVQPVAIAYTGLQGLPMGRRLRPLAAWYGDMDLVPHLWVILKEGALDLTIRFADPIRLGPGSDRKAVTAAAEQTVRRLAAAALTGRDPVAAPDAGRS